MPKQRPAKVIGDDSIGTAFGNTSSGILCTPGQVNSNVSIGKTFRARWPSEDANVTFRSDFFNAFNHPNFGSPGVTYGTASFGQITAMSTNPRVIQFSLKLGF